MFYGNDLLSSKGASDVVGAMSTSDSAFNFWGSDPDCGKKYLEKNIKSDRASGMLATQGMDAETGAVGTVSITFDKHGKPIKGHVVGQRADGSMFVASFPVNSNGEMMKKLNVKQKMDGSYWYPMTVIVNSLVASCPCVGEAPGMVAAAQDDGGARSPYEAACGCVGSMTSDNQEQVNAISSTPVFPTNASPDVVTQVLNNFAKASGERSNINGHIHPTLLEQPAALGANIPVGNFFLARPTRKKDTQASYTNLARRSYIPPGATMSVPTEATFMQSGKVITQLQNWYE